MVITMSFGFPFSKRSRAIFLAAIKNAVAAADGDLRDGTPGDADTRRETPLILLHQRVRAAPGDFEPGVGDVSVEAL